MIKALGILRETALLMIGQPCYRAYCDHMAHKHPDRVPMTRVEFFRNKEQARYGGKHGGKCC